MVRSASSATVLSGIAACGFDRCGAPGADGSGNHGDDVEEIEGAALEVLAGDVFERLPAGPEVDAIADLGVAGDGADCGSAKWGMSLEMASAAMTVSASMPT